MGGGLSVFFPFFFFIYFLNFLVGKKFKWKGHSRDIAVVGWFSFSFSFLLP